MVITGVFSCCSNKPDALNFFQNSSQSSSRESSKSSFPKQISGLGWIGSLDFFVTHWVGLGPKRVVLGPRSEGSSLALNPGWAPVLGPLCPGCDHWTTLLHIGIIIVIEVICFKIWSGI